MSANARFCRPDDKDKSMKRLWLLLLVATAAPAAAAQQANLTGDQQAAVTRAEAYLDALDTVQARFVQVSSNGAYAEGTVFVERPGKLRFEYDPPHPALLIANGLTLLYYDRELKQASYLPLWETPLWFLIREDVVLGDALEVTQVAEEPGLLAITVRNRESPDQGLVTLGFEDAPFALKQWEILDAQGIATRVTLINPRYDQPIDKAIFDASEFRLENLRRPDGR
jgi:outer membrane lipoprotein-sorting protein